MFPLKNLARKGLIPYRWGISWRKWVTAGSYKSQFYRGNCQKHLENTCRWVPDDSTGDKLIMVETIADSPRQLSQKAISVSPSDVAYMHRRTGLALRQVVACRLFGTKPLYKLIIINHTPTDFNEKILSHCASGYDSLRYIADVDLSVIRHVNHAHW